MAPQTDSGLHISLAAERVGSLFGIPITNTILMTWVVIAVLLVLGFLVRRNISLVPGKLQNMFEMLVEYILDLLAKGFESEVLARRYFPLIATIFLFILTANLLEFSPFIGSWGVYQNGTLVPLLHTPTADLNTTLALALISFFVIELSGILTLGLLKYGGKFVNFNGGAIGFVVGLLELIGNLARLVSFSFRLFGAIFAGEVLILVITHFLPYIASAPLMAFEAFVGILQAGIFAILTMAFIKIAVEEPHGASSTHAHASH